eukprot:CAMPEP_0185207930 /NCGR_PEP_ID=MMETSP1140-20130426/61156_1 /TAXON_ID=298111 /ORGANISM="Pavlova sp., Strain CCMP459" /LENGTH=83 /DNA_ID=CAMNT_0027775633 /DNA_START=71 /DNA_END=322 /DNA_ORIENTATION=-
MRSAVVPPKMRAAWGVYVLTSSAASGSPLGAGGGQGIMQWLNRPSGRESPNSSIDAAALKANAPPSSAMVRSTKPMASDTVSL